jgi:two-component system sensor histidine kinase CiaH
MIKKLRRKFVWIVMAVVTIILLAIFFTLLLTTQRNNARMSVDLLRHALSTRALPQGAAPTFMGDGMNGPPGAAQRPTLRTRLPILLLEVDAQGAVSVISNQLHFVGEEDIAPIAELALSGPESIGVLPGYALRYLKEDTGSKKRIAFADTTMEQELLWTQMMGALLIESSAMLVFFLLSLLLARWAVHPVEVAWEQQKQFIANASHELKTPLTVILSNADILQSENIFGDPRDSRRMEHIQAEALHMKQLVADMLTLARSDSRERTESDAPADFSYLVKSAVLMYEPMVYDEGKRLLYAIEEGLWTQGDGQRLEQVTHILLDNAQKYTALHGDIHVELGKADHKSLLLKVCNEGEPIPKGELERIFLRFYRRDEARSEYASFGLGLSIAQSIVDAHKGRIWAESDEKTGNSFYVSLPLHPAPSCAD